MSKKWVINDNRVCLGHVEYHREFFKDNSKTTSGGFWHIDAENNCIYFYGISEEFGRATKEQFFKAEMRQDILRRKMIIYFSNKYSLGEVLREPTENLLDTELFECTVCHQPKTQQEGTWPKRASDGTPRIQFDKFDRFDEDNYVTQFVCYDCL